MEKGPAPAAPLSAAEPPRMEPPSRGIAFETGAAWLDLIATVGWAYGPAPVERLCTAGHLRDWLASKDLRPAADPVEADLSQARELREALRSLALAAVRSQPPPAAALAFVNRILAADQPLHLETAGASGPGLRAGTVGVACRPPDTTHAALARLARQAAEDLAGARATSLRTCAEPECAALFLDPGGRRRWCTANGCGVRNRVRAHRQRQQRRDRP